MELIEGAPIGEHFNSLKEKNMKFPEDRVWNIFMQVGGKKLKYEINIHVNYSTVDEIGDVLRR